MYENQTKSTPEHAPRAPISGVTATGDSATSDSATRRTDPKFVRESFTMRRMLPWQIGALAIAAALVVGLAFFYLF